VDSERGLRVCFLQRPTAKELLKHPFIKKAKKTSCLVDLIDRLRTWKSQGNHDSDSDDDEDANSKSAK